jgi:HSP20 family protein
MAAKINKTPRSITIVERPVSLFDELARDLWYSWPFRTTFEGMLSPRIDMFEEKDELVIKGELPSLKKEDFDITLDGDMLSIKAEKKEEKVSEDARYYSCERSFGQFVRSVSLPFPVNFDKISSTYVNGVLEIRLPKAEEAKAKHIEVHVK